MRTCHCVFFFTKGHYAHNMLSIFRQFAHLILFHLRRLESNVSSPEEEYGPYVSGPPGRQGSRHNPGALGKYRHEILRNDGFMR